MIRRHLVQAKSLRLLKHYVIVVQGSGSIAPFILSLSTICSQSALRPGRFIHGKRVPSALWVEGLVGLRSGLDAAEKINALATACHVILSRFAETSHESSKQRREGR